MTYVEVRTGDDSDSPRFSSESQSVPSQSRRSAAREGRKCRKEEAKRPRQRVMSLTNCGPEEKLQVRPRDW